MSKIVEMPLDGIYFPKACCRCNSNKYEIVEHSDDVVIATTLGVTAYKKITIDIPLCNKCEMASIPWFIAAAIFWGCLIFFVHSDNMAIFTAISGLISLIIGAKKRPIKIMKLDEKENILKVMIYNLKYANKLIKELKVVKPV